MEYFLQLESECLARIKFAVSRFPDLVVSHHSAAFLHGLPIPDLKSEVTVIDPQRRSTSLVGIERHRCSVPAQNITRKNGIRLTDLLRTTVDCARAFDAAHGLAVIDETLNSAVSREQLHAMNEDLPSKRGRAKARWLIDAGLVGVDSPMESRLRFILQCAGFGQPVIQFLIPSLDGRRFFADIAFPALGLVFEYDGRAKYGAAADLIAEKAREDAIRLRGWRVIRVQASEVRNVRDAVAHFRSVAASLGVVLGPELRLPFVDGPSSR